jgi:hypothetical protein
MRVLDEVLGFAADGKLEKLCMAGSPNLLNEWEQEIDLGGKSFRPAGWDECFPTIDPYQNSPVMGELIGLSPEIYWQENCVEQIWRSTRFEARRHFSLETSSCLEMSFQVTNLEGSALEFLWASHALFSLKNLTTVRLSNDVSISSFDVNGSENKWFIANTKPIELLYPNFRVSLISDQPWWGIWLNLGGWPEKSRNLLCCLGVEATNTPGEHPDGRWLHAGEIFTGKVKIETHS